MSFSSFSAAYNRGRLAIELIFFTLASIKGLDDPQSFVGFALLTKLLSRSLSSASRARVFSICTRDAMSQDGL